MKRVRSSKSAVISSNCIREIGTLATLLSCSNVIVVWSRVDKVRLASSASLSKLSHSGRTLSRIEALALLHECLSRIINDPLIPVDSSKLDIPGSGNSGVILAIDLHYRHVEGAASEVIDKDCLFLFRLACRRQEADRTP